MIFRLFICLWLVPVVIVATISAAIQLDFSLLNPANWDSGWVTLALIWGVISAMMILDVATDYP